MPVFCYPPYLHKCIDLGADTFAQVAFEGMGSALRQSAVAGITAFWGGRSGQHDAVHEKFPLADQPGHTCPDLVKFGGVPAEGVENVRIVQAELDVVSVLNRGVFFDYFDFIAGGCIGKG